jgi:predicted benzoate:H+ symporter BenE
MRIAGNNYNLMEFAGAFGDLGTLIPFVIGYITINRMDPLGILLAFGLFMIITGQVFRTPIPVQPMKAIGASAIAHGAAVTHGMIWGAGLLTGLLWLIMGASGAITWIEKITTKPVIRGIMLGLGLSFMIKGLDLRRPEPLISVAAFAATALLLRNRKIPAILILLIFGVIVSLVTNPGLWGDMLNISARFRMPELTLPKLGLQDLAAGFVMLALPQIPLTLGNAVIGTAAANNQQFPHRPVSTRTVSLSHGIMNLAGSSIGGVPLCHGAGGIAGHVRFGATTGGSLVILGVLLLVMGFFFSDSVSLIFSVFPSCVLGVILFFAGVELSMTLRDIKLKRQNLCVLIITAGIAMWNMGVAYVTGLLLYYLVRKGWVKF